MMCKITTHHLQIFVLCYPFPKNLNSYNLVINNFFLPAILHYFLGLES